MDIDELIEKMKSGEITLRRKQSCWFCKYHFENRKDPGDYFDEHENYCCYPDERDVWSSIIFQIPNQLVYNKKVDKRCPLPEEEE